MADKDSQDLVERSAEFERQAEETPSGLLVEFAYFLRYNKKWWLIPILVTLALLGVLVFLSSTTALPWIYAIF